MVRPGGRQHERLIPRVEDAADGHVQGLHTGARHDDLRLGIKLHPLDSEVVTGQILTKPRQTGIFSIEGVAIIQRLQGGSFDIFRCGNVRFPEI